MAGLLATAILALGGTASAALPANASTVTSASASAFQNKILGAALARISGGTRISAGEDEWDGGRVIVGVTEPAAATSPSFDTPVKIIGDTAIYSQRDQLVCTAGYFCAYGAQQFSGTCWMYIEGGSLNPGDSLELNWAAFSGAYCGSAGTWSWINESTDRVWKEQSFSHGTALGYYFYQNGTASGTTYCIDPFGGSNSEETDVKNSAVRTLGWIYMSDNTSAC